MRLASLLAASFLCLATPAQTTSASVADVGLTMQIGTSTGSVTAIAGQVCGPFSCTPFVSVGPTTASTPTRIVRVYGAANSLYVLAMSTASLAGPCVSVPGIGNALVLGQPMVVLAFGVTGPSLPSTSVACQQGVGTFLLTLPPVAPAVIAFLVQGLTYSHATGGPAFTVAIRGYAY